MSSKSLSINVSKWRYWLVIAILMILPISILIKVAFLQILPSQKYGFDFLKNQGEMRAIRNISIPAVRGSILDRNGKPLAISTPVVDIVGNPQKIMTQDHTKLAEALGISVQILRKRLDLYKEKSFVYLSRQLSDQDAKAILDLNIKGISQEKQFKRFYPAGEVTAQLVGITDYMDSGQEGLELAFNDWLKGEEGFKKVVMDEKRRVINNLALLKSSKPGNNLRLSIDLRIQYAAYTELKKSVKKHGAKAGSIVVLDVSTGEIIAMVNQPSFNPNNRTTLDQAALRNRAITDLIEPGSTVKPFTILAALESGEYDSDSVVNTSPGYLKVDYKTFVDPVNYGNLDLTGVLSKSSQVGTTKIALNLNPESIRDVFSRVGFGDYVGSGFPGETMGSLPAYRKWHPVTQATFAFGYGISVSPLQLAKAYGILANNGLKRDVTLLAVEEIASSSRVLDKDISHDVTRMLTSAVSKTGTGKNAMIDSYSVAGKTGTLHKVKSQGGYEDNKYISAFAGFSPTENPKIVTVVIIDEPARGDYFGGLVAAPIFSKVTERALQLMQISPDKPLRPLSHGDAVFKKGESS